MNDVHFAFKFQTHCCMADDPHVYCIQTLSYALAVQITNHLTWFVCIVFSCIFAKFFQSFQKISQKFFYFFSDLLSRSLSSADTFKLFSSVILGSFTSAILNFSSFKHFPFLRKKHSIESWSRPQSVPNCLRTHAYTLYFKIIFKQKGIIQKHGFHFLT